ncbi:MAG: hypothetical protein KAI66_24955, partial [Lentisphaeria bacterium]|nr:hypothetical protein [Lentisphaeria bacterium]
STFRQDLTGRRKAEQKKNERQETTGSRTHAIQADTAFKSFLTTDGHGWDTNEDNKQEVDRVECHGKPPLLHDL